MFYTYEGGGGGGFRGWCGVFFVNDHPPSPVECLLDWGRGIRMRICKVVDLEGRWWFGVSGVGRWVGAGFLAAVPFPFFEPPTYQLILPPIYSRRKLAKEKKKIELMKNELYLNASLLNRDKGGEYIIHSSEFHQPPQPPPPKNPFTLCSNSFCFLLFIKHFPPSPSSYLKIPSLDITKPQV